ncbi:MAG TPA: hypothetical protein VKA59_13500 [Vicinamibacterales bacterium]|nr:hypothetical protein [Vicinamibacterales bacterium]
MAAARLLWMPLTSAAVTMTSVASSPIANATVRNFAVDETNEQATRRDDTCVERIQRQR